MALPTREELLSHVEFRFRELAPDEPVRLDPNEPSQQAMIRQWHQAHHEVLSKFTDATFFGYYPDAPARLDPVEAGGDPGDQLIQLTGPAVGIACVRHGSTPPCQRQRSNPGCRTRAFSTFTDPREAARPWARWLDWVQLSRNCSRCA